MGAVGKRATSPTSAKIRAAPAGPMPWMSIRCDPLAATAALSSAFIALSLASRRPMSASSSAAIRRRVLPAGSRGRTVASSAFSKPSKTHTPATTTPEPQLAARTAKDIGPAAVQGRAQQGVRQNSLICVLAEDRNANN